ncbi:MAG TPA: alpha/beta hydrolase domain-containing protein [Candidatus Sulfotelmatobacter sp.]|nr:alpha/beta hydrolase domain-containing protein [Candidatus Sulfotelmatobacter sp.]
MHPSAFRLAVILAATLGVVPAACGGSGTTPPRNLPTPNPALALKSRVVSMTVLGQLPVGTFNGVPYVKTYGVISGIIDPKEAVVNIGSQPKDANGMVDYTTQYEIIAPAAGSAPDTVILVDAENRSSAISLGSLNQSPASTGGTSPDGQMWATGMGNGFLQNNATAYGRVQWQSSATTNGDNTSIPANAQGEGLVVERDFGRMLAGTTAAPTVTGATYTPPTFATRIFTGISQSAWTVNTLLAEGFNVDPTNLKAVFQGMIPIDGTGNWLAINNLGAAAGAPMGAYLDPNANAGASPLSAAQLLSRPGSDPFYIDVANYTDFYRVFASLSDSPTSIANYRRYDWPGPHGASAVPAAASGAGVFAPNPAVTQGGACDAGVSVATNPIGYQPYFRAIFLELEKQLGVAAASSAPSLPASTYFTLTSAPSVQTTVVNGATLNTFNDSIGATLQVPALDANMWPQGGVRTPDEMFPLGQPTEIASDGAQEVSLPPALTNSISDTCGNTGVFNVFSSSQLTTLYGNQANYVAQYDTQVKALIAAGYVLASDETYMDTTAGTLFGYAVNGPPYNGGTNF